MSDALFRLIGDGDRHSGGAIPLPDAFAAVLNELVDHGSASFSKLNHLISEALAYKEERVMAAAWRSWSAFTRDILAALEEMHLVKENDSRWELTPEFVPGYIFTLPGTDIGFTGRAEADRNAWEHNSLLHMAVNPIILTLEKTPYANTEARQLLYDAEKILSRELKLDKPPQITRYQQRHPRKPHEQRKRLRSGMTAFFRDIFWNEYAEDSRWYDLKEIAAKFEELNPDQPPINNGDLMGSMRKVGREMAESRVLEMQRVMGNGAWKHVFRKKVNDPYRHAPGAVAEVMGDPKA